MRWLPSLILLFTGITGLFAESPDEATPTVDEVSVAEEAGNTSPAVTEDRSTAKATATWERPKAELPADGVASVYVIPIHDAIGKTNKYVLRRGLKEAIENGIEVVVLDVNTPGGRVDVMMEMMEMLDRFEGRTIAYVNDEALSAGALISAATDDIFFAPNSVIGAAAVISGSGQDIPETLKAKIDSYMDAKLRALTRTHPRRADVVRAMMQTDYVLEFDGTIIKDAGSLLTLTDFEAMELYGEPPKPLLGSGIYKSVEELLESDYGEGRYEIRTYEVRWSEKLAQFMEMISPILIGVGFLALMIEFYTPGFGFAGIAGLSLLAIVFLSNFVAGLAGHEPLLLFGLGFLLVMLELLVLPGTIFMAVGGIILMLGSLVWSLADIWPRDGGGIDVDYGTLTGAAMEVTGGLILAIVGFALIFRFLPRSWMVDKLILQGAAGGTNNAGKIASPSPQGSGLPAVGEQGKAVTDLRPTGTVEIGGKQFEASVGFGTATRGSRVVVTGYRQFYLLVDVVED